MAKADVLARVKQDLALGQTFLATQRLRTLVAIEPEELELRAMLAAVYRQTGNLAESGRWAFLTAELTTAELTAFERANPDAWLRRRMLRWDGDPASLPEVARQRLAALDLAAHETGPPTEFNSRLARTDERQQSSRGATIPCLFVLIALVGIGTLVTIGVIRVLGWVTG